MKFGHNRRLRKKIRRQGAPILRNEAYFSYAAVTKDAAQRSIRAFYEAVWISEAVFELQNNPVVFLPPAIKAVGLSPKEFSREL